LRGIQNSFPIAKFFYEQYFRVESYGLENIPPNGRVLIIPNHSGQLPFDGALVGYALITNPHGPRTPKAMMERFFPTVPFIGNALNRMGAVLGDPENCRIMLENEQAIIVFPEGVGGANKVFSKRYQLQKFGKGFVHLAMQYKTPIIPVGIVGCEESIVSLANFKSIGKKIGLPAFPIVIPIIWPTKVIIHFGQPIYLPDEEVNDANITKNVKFVKNEVKKLIDLGLSKRENLFD
jgi:1-acyl-sn-glycerol-3-phosphate acyltransferase